MNKKQLLQQVEQLAAKAGESAQELQALRIRLAENEQALEQCREELQAVCARCAVAEQKVKELECKTAQPAPVLPMETAVFEKNAPAEPREQEATPAEPFAAAVSPSEESAAEEQAPKARIPAFCEEEADFEAFFHADEAENTQSLLEELPDLEPLTTATNAEIPAKEQPAETAPAEEIPSETVQSEKNAAALQDVIFESSAAPAVQSASDLQNYCARLIGRIALAAARVIVHCPEQPETANIKDLALAQSEKFKTQATACLNRGGEVAALQQQLDTLAAETEQYLNGLSAKTGE